VSFSPIFPFPVLRLPPLIKLLTRSGEKRLAYNLSPSFNWKTAMSNKEQETYIERLASLGYCWQFITLAGLHQTALIADQFTKDYAKRGMAAYGETIQEKEAEVGTDVLTHQKVRYILAISSSPFPKKQKRRTRK